VFRCNHRAEGIVNAVLWMMLRQHNYTMLPRSCCGSPARQFRLETAAYPDGMVLPSYGGVAVRVRLVVRQLGGARRSMSTSMQSHCSISAIAYLSLALVADE